MSTIKFSHKYEKLKDHNGDVIREAFLLDVVPIQIEDMSREFLAYDTDCGLFYLPPKGSFLMLIFSKSGRDIFTTIRRSTPEKKKYYLSRVGLYFDVQIIEEAKP